MENLQDNINIIDSYHVPVMLKECIEGLDIKPDGVYVDVTFGGGGHSKEILKHLGPKGRLFAFDQDEQAIQNAIDDKRFVLIRSNFRFFWNFLRYFGFPKVDGILADLGISSHHIDDKDRGFSFRFDTNLDMRMNQQNDFSARELINQYSIEELTKIFKDYAEVNNAYKLAQNIVNYRSKKEIVTIGQLIEAMGNQVPKQKENKYLAQVFQAIRIEVNKEIEVLQEFLSNTKNALKENGRLVIMTYHSLEDRPVKNYIKSGNFLGKISQDVFGNIIAPFTQQNRKVITASDSELDINPRSRSAKLRIAVRSSMQD